MSPQGFWMFAIIAPIIKGIPETHTHTHTRTLLILGYYPYDLF